jgi:succinoglycan biosynthesis transport protein ExoP
MNSAAPNSEEMAQLPGRGIKPLVSLRAHPRLALWVFIAVFLVGLPFVFIKGTKLYWTSATVHVAPRYMKTLRDDDEVSIQSNTQYREYVENLRNSMTRYDIIEAAFKKLDPVLQRRWILPVDKSERMTIERLRGVLDVRNIPDTYVLEASITDKEPVGMAEMINAVTEVFIEKMREERVYGADERKKKLITREDEILKKISTLTSERSEIGLKIGANSFGGTAPNNPYDQVIEKQRVLLTDARNTRVAAETRLKAFEKTGETESSMQSIRSVIDQDPSLSNLKLVLQQRRANLFLQQSGITPEHPSYAGIQDEIQAIDAELEGRVSASAESAKEGATARYMASIIQARLVEEEIDKGMKDLLAKSNEYTVLAERATGITYEIDQNRSELNAIRERLNTMEAESDSFGFVRLVNAAVKPEQPHGPRKILILAIIIVVATGAGITATVAFDLFDRRIHTVNDAEKTIGIPAMGWMIEIADRGSQLFSEDLLRRIAGSLIREQNEQGTYSFAFTAVKPAAGSTTLALKIANTLTALGYPALFLEANAFNPDARINQQNPQQKGLNEALQGADPYALILPASEEFPDRLSVGNLHGSRHLNLVEKIGPLLEKLHARYRFIIVDMPPLLLSADTSILSQQIQQLIVVSEASGTIRGELKRAGRELEKIDPAAVGLIVNRIRPFVGGGYLSNVIVEYLTGKKSSESKSSKPAGFARSLFFRSRKKNA